MRREVCGFVVRQLNSWTAETEMIGREPPQHEIYFYYRIRRKSVQAAFLGEAQNNAINPHALL